MSRLILIVPLVVTFSIVVWNMYLPMSSYKNSEFLNYVNYLFVKGYKQSDYIQQYIDKPIVQPVGKYFAELLTNGTTQRINDLGPRQIQDNTHHYVTLTFYVEYGNQQRLPDLLDLLDHYHINKAVFLVEKRFMHEHEFLIKRIQDSGYVIHTWNNLTGYNDRNYPATVYQNMALSGSGLLSIVHKDRDAKEFLNAALHYRNANIVAFTPNIMYHQIVLEEILKQNGNGLIFTDTDNTKPTTMPNQNYVTKVSAGLSNSSPSDSFLKASQFVDGKPFSFLRISNGTWTMESLQKKYPSVISYMSVQNAFLISKPLIIDKKAELKILDSNVFLKASYERATPVFIEILGKGLIQKSTITSWDPVINASSPDPYHPRPYVVVRDARNVDILNSTLSHLGYSLGGISDTRFAHAAVEYYNSSNFTIAHSTIALNYYGFYSEHSNNFKIINNDIYGQTRYGLDPHTGSVDFIIDSNKVHDNGNQGIICSIQCENVTITNNVVDHNVEGIGLHWLTNSSLVRNNIITNNEKYGIFIQKQSFNNLVENNRVQSNGKAIGLLTGSMNNTIRSNIIADNLANIVYMDGESKPNIIQDNHFSISSNSPNDNSSSGAGFLQR
jgi:mannuronan 5-epimerase